MHTIGYRKCLKDVKVKKNFGNKVKTDERSDGKKLSEKREVWSLIEWLVRGAVEKNGVNEDGIFSDVNPEGFRAPSSYGLYGSKVCASFC